MVLIPLRRPALSDAIMGENGEADNPFPVACRDKGMMRTHTHTQTQPSHTHSYVQSCLGLHFSV